MDPNESPQKKQLPQALWSTPNFGTPENQQ